MHIRKEKDSDAIYIAYIHQQAFEGPDEARIVDALRNNHSLKISLVCEVDGKIVGHIAYSPIYHNEEIIGLGLAPVAVLPKCQNQGIGSALIKEGNKIAFREGYKKIFVLGDRKYYSRFDFELAKKYNYTSNFDPEGNNFMVLGKNLLKSNKEMLVHYCKEFSK